MVTMTMQWSQWQCNSHNDNVILKCNDNVIMKCNGANDNVSMKCDGYNGNIIIRCNGCNNNVIMKCNGANGNVIMKCILPSVAWRWVEMMSLFFVVMKGLCRWNIF